MSYKEDGWIRQEYDRQGNIVKRLACRFHDPNLSKEFANGRTIKSHPIILFCADVATRTPCEVSEKEMAVDPLHTVPKEECDIQRELEICPRGLGIQIPPEIKS